jgi:hypothetical protein
MPILSVSDLLLVTTPDDALNLELAIAATLGLPTTAWQPLSPEMTIFGVNAQIIASYSATINLIAQGGFPTSAATIPGTGASSDGAGFLLTWMDLCSVAYYNVSRVPASFATGNVPVNNTSAAPYTYAVGQLHFQNPLTGATYTNTSAGTIAAATAGQNIAIQADAGFPGSSGSVSAGNKLVMLTPLSGVTPQPIAVSLVGTNIETNAALLLRGQAKLGSLSPNGAASAYNYVATSVPTPAARPSATFPFNQLVDPLGNPITVSSPITRVATQLNPVTGVVGVYIANSSGAPLGPDVSAIAAALQATAVPLSTTATVAAVGTVPLDLFYNVYVRQSTGLSAAQVIANINDAARTFCQTAPIGGWTTTAPNIIPYDELIDVIINANPGTVDLQLLNPPGNLPIGTTSVPVPGTTSVTTANVFFV